jgi:hypothetical protein
MSEGERLTVTLGTPGSDPDAFVTMGYDLVPQDALPKIEIEFPTATAGRALKQTFILKRRC